MEWLAGDYLNSLSCYLQKHTAVAEGFSLDNKSHVRARYIKWWVRL